MKLEDKAQITSIVMLYVFVALCVGIEISSHNGFSSHGYHVCEPLKGDVYNENEPLHTEMKICQADFSYLEDGITVGDVTFFFITLPSLIIDYIFLAFMLVFEAIIRFLGSFVLFIADIKLV